MRPNLINRLKEEWNNLDPVDPLRGLLSDAIDALAEQPAQQEPFGYFRYDLRLDAWVQNRAGLTGTPFYTSPQRTWVGLTDEEVHALWMTGEANIAEEQHSVVAYEIEAKLKEKNT